MAAHVLACVLAVFFLQGISAQTMQMGMMAPSMGPMAPAPAPFSPMTLNVTLLPMNEVPQVRETPSRYIAG